MASTPMRPTATRRMRENILEKLKCMCDEEEKEVLSVFILRIYMAHAVMSGSARMQLSFIIGCSNYS